MLLKLPQIGLIVDSNDRHSYNERFSLFCKRTIARELKEYNKFSLRAQKQRGAVFNTGYSINSANWDCIAKPVL